MPILILVAYMDLKLRRFRCPALTHVLGFDPWLVPPLRVQVVFSRVYRLFLFPLVMVFDPLMIGSIVCDPAALAVTKT